MIPVILIVVLLGVVLWYALAGRAWLKQQPWAKGFFARIEPIEVRLYKKSETMLIGRLMWVSGFLVTSYDSLATFLPSLDLTPVTNRLLSSVPDDMRSLVISGAVMGLGLLINWLRKRTTKPLDAVAAGE